jgi:chromosome segregation ATPase
MAGTSYSFNKSISSDIEDLKRIQVIRNRLEKATFDYQAKAHTLATLTSENSKLKVALEAETKEQQRLNAGPRRHLSHLVSEQDLIHSELEISQTETDKYKAYAAELERNNQNWRKECDKQGNILAELVGEAEELNRKLIDADTELHQRRSELSQAMLERQSFVKSKAALDRQRHNLQILETDYQTLKKQNEELKVYIEGLEEERMQTEAVVAKAKREAAHSQVEISLEAQSLQGELENSRIIASNQEKFIEELRTEIDQLRKQNLYLKNKLDLAS